MCLVTKLQPLILSLLTVLKQAQGISAVVVGPERKTVISLDMGLYKPAKQLQMSRNDLNDIILRPGELHVVMAQLRSIGSYIENSGIDQTFIEADVYGPTTVKQIIEGKHVKWCPGTFVHVAGIIFIVPKEFLPETSRTAREQFDNGKEPR